MTSKLIAPLALLLCLCVGTGCTKSRFEAKLEADGAGSVKLQNALTEGMVEVFHKMMEIDPDDEMLDQVRSAQLREVDESTKLALSEQGIELKNVSSVFDEKQVESDIEALFAHPGAVRHLSQLQVAGSQAVRLRLTREDDGIYKLAMETYSPASAEAEEEIVDLGGLEEQPQTPEEMKKQMQMFSIMGKMMGEIRNLEMVFALEVPGEIVSVEPEEKGVIDGQTVSWTLNGADVMDQSFGGALLNAFEDMDDETRHEHEPTAEMKYAVRFKMPEGQEIPEEALITFGDNNVWDAPPPAPIPGLEDLEGEEAAVAALRKIAQIQGELKEALVYDQDEDGVGEYAFMMELAHWASMHSSEGNIEETTNFLSPEFSESLTQGGGIATAGGYHFRLFLPAPEGKTAPDNGKSLPVAEHADLHESAFLCYAWPVEAGVTGEQAFVISEEGQVYVTANLDFQDYSGLDLMPAGDAALQVGEAEGHPLGRMGFGLARDGSLWTPYDQ